MKMIVSVIVWLLPFCMGGSIPGGATNGTLTLGFSAPWEQGWTVGPYLGSAIVLGIEEVYRRQILPGYSIDWVMRDDYCEPRRGMQMAVDMWASVEDLDGIIGPGCSVVCQPASLLAAAWGIPVVSFSCSGPSLTDKNTYPTFTRVEHTDMSKTPVYEQIARMMGWRRVGILSTTEDLHRKSAISTMQELQRQGKEAILQLVDTTIRGDQLDMNNFQVLQQTMRSIKNKARIFILMAYQADLRNMLISALDAGMLNGEYAFITSEYLLAVMDVKQTFRPEVDSVIYDGLMAIGVRVPSGPAWDEFRARVIDAFQLPYFDHITHLPPTASIDQVNVYAGNLHDAVLQWAYGVNRTLGQGFPPDDGLRIAANIFNTEFEGITGTVAIDANGDRKPNLRVISLRGMERVVMMEWVAAEAMMRKVYKPQGPHDWSGIIWHGNGTTVPRDTPICGWLDELCQQDEPNNDVTIISLSLSVIVVLFILTLSCFVIKKKKYESNLKNIGNITIAWDSLSKISQGKIVGSLNSMASSKPSHGIKYDKNVLRQGLQIYDYNEIQVLINDLGSAPIEFQDRKVLIDLDNMRELAHDNVNVFIGICSEPPHVCYIMAYASRGTLQDIISDEDLVLTKDFKVSFVLDVACGMWYLHQSAIQYHGHLSSAHCVVNNRWACKITGHGLSYIKQQYKVNKERDRNPAKLLWSAPERLQGSNQPSVAMLQKGDVYSFGILSQEIFLKDVPYGANEPELEPAETVKRVQEGASPPYRPVIPDGTCSNGWVLLMEECWAQKIEDRPTFTNILERINEIHKYKNMDLVDNMIKRLERHTQNLEERVGQRSRELVAEQGRVEAVLGELLPPSVARLLAMGRHVQPESFEESTLFFSDIVGFTRISSEATPMDIVVLLNTMYTLFDDVAQNYDVYKVATIGDAYMVASGLPIRNGDRHAHEISSLALELLRVTQDFVIPHMPDEHLRMRIGIHSGPCVAGVTGLKMPRYLLFGDTVDIAAKMESGGEAMKVHISSDTRELIKSNVSYRIVARGTMDIKGKDPLETYWLYSK